MFGVRRAKDFGNLQLGVVGLSVSHSNPSGQHVLWSLQHTPCGRKWHFSTIFGDFYNHIYVFPLATLCQLFAKLSFFVNTASITGGTTSSRFTNCLSRTTFRIQRRNVQDLESLQNVCVYLRLVISIWVFILHHPMINMTTTRSEKQWNCFWNYSK